MARDGSPVGRAIRMWCRSVCGDQLKEQEREERERGGREEGVWEIGREEGEERRHGYRCYCCYLQEL